MPYSFGSFRSRLLAAAFALVIAPAWAPAQEPATEPPPPEPDPTAALFDNTQFPDIRLRMNKKDFLALSAAYGENTYYPADFVWRDQIVRNVGIRSRGSGSRNPNKPGLKVDFDRYSSDQTFLGLKSLVLDNNYQDPAIIREWVTMKFYARMGLPAPRETFVKLWINDEILLGVYAVVESMDKRFLQRAGLDKQGYLYDYDYMDEWWFTYLGSDYKPYSQRFQPDTKEHASMSELYGPIENFVRSINESGDITRNIGDLIDIPTFLRYLAVESFVGEWDGLVGYFGANNFYLYRASDGQRFSFLPWDRDNTFKALDYPIWPDGMNNNVLTSRLMEVPEYRQFFLQAILDCAAAAEATEPKKSEGEESPDAEAPPSQPWLLHEIETQFEQIREAALADNRKLHQNNRFLEDIEFLKQFARERPAFARAEVERHR